MVNVKEMFYQTGLQISLKITGKGEKTRVGF